MTQQKLVEPPKAAGNPHGTNVSVYALLLAFAFLYIPGVMGQATVSPSTEKENTAVLVHYWNFNDNSTLSGLMNPTLSLVSGGMMTVIPGGTSYINVTGGTGQNFDIANHNARLGDSAGAHLRFDNPIGGEIVFNLPTTGFSDPVVRFAMRRSGQGAGIQFWHYATDASQTFIPYQTLVPINGNPLPITLDFTGIAGTSDNPHFALKVSFAQGAGGTAGNNRFDNFTLDAQPIFTTPLIGSNSDTLPHFSHLFGTPSPAAGMSVSAINLSGNIEILAPAAFQVSFSPDSGFAQGVTVTHSMGSVPIANIFVRLNAPAPGTFDGSLFITSPGADTVRVAVSGTCLALPPPLSLISYWHFNNLNTSAGDVKEIDADHHTVPGTTARMIYTGGSPGDRDMDSYSDGSDLNLHLGEAAGQAARVRNPSDNRSLVFHLPSTNFRNLRFTYAVHRSNNGQLTHEIDYSTDGVNFIQTGLPQTTFAIAETYDLIQVDLSGIAAVENNPLLLLRITFVGNTGGTSGNNRFDNISLEGEVISSSPSTFLAGEKPFVLFPNPVPAGTTVRLNQTVSFRVFDLHGRHLFSGHETNEFTTAGLAPGVYLLVTGNGMGNKVLVY